MGIKSDYVQNNFNDGEISQDALGRFDLAKYPNSVALMENWIPKEIGGALFRTGTRYVAETKTMTDRSRLLKFFYNNEQTYVIEAGDLYFRFYTNDGQLMSLGSPVELVTPFAIANIDKIRYAQNADVMYIATGTYHVQKLTRTSATTFTIEEVSFVRGPFLDTNTSATTITATADTGTGITLTASTAIFTSDHVGSLWRVKDGVVKITGFSSTTILTGDVQAEPDGTAGNLGTGGSPDTDWAEGAWSAERGYPKVVQFYEGRLVFANTDYQINGIWGSVPFAYENFDKGSSDDDDAYSFILDTTDGIRWMSPSTKALICGTAGGVLNVGSGSTGIGITPSNINSTPEHDFGTADLEAKRMYNLVYYVQSDLKKFLESGYFFDIDQEDAVNTTLLADHILQVQNDAAGNPVYRGDDETGGLRDFDVQQSPTNRIWGVRNDGQIAVLTRNPREKVNGWCRLILGDVDSCDGKSGAGQCESISIITKEGKSDQIWIIANRVVNGSVVRYVEYFTEEDFKYEWDAIRLDSSLTLDNPLTITDITDTLPNVVTATAHGFSTGDEIRLDNIVGKYQLNGTVWTITVLSANTFELTTQVT
jgi:hypothetical protein